MYLKKHMAEQRRRTVKRNMWNRSPIACKTQSQSIHGATRSQQQDKSSLNTVKFYFQPHGGANELSSSLTAHSFIIWTVWRIHRLYREYNGDDYAHAFLILLCVQQSYDLSNSISSECLTTAIFPGNRVQTGRLLIGCQ